MTEIRSQPKPRTWVDLNHSANDGDTAKAYCSYIESFIWRERDNQPDELLVIINDQNSVSRRRYKYKGVTEETFKSAWSRAYNPSEYDNSFGSWFNTEIRNSYDCERFD